MHLVAGDPERHPLLAALGPEPLSPAFSAEHMYGSSRGRRASVQKEALMDSRMVAGVGNIYANEALFRAGIDIRRTPRRPHQPGTLRRLVERCAPP